MNKMIWLGSLLLIMLALSARAEEQEAPTQTLYGEWTKQCEQLPQRSEPTCYLFQNMVLKETGQRVMLITLGYLGENPNQLVSILSLPLGIYLPAGVRFRVEDGTVATMVVQHCDNEGCKAAMPIDPLLFQALTTNDSAQVQMVNTQRKELALPVSLKGLPEGFKALRKKD